MNEAESIQNGGTEYTYSREWLGIYWPADEYAYIRLTAENSFDGFYCEAGEVLSEICHSHGGGEEIQRIVAEAIHLNASLLHQPYLSNDLDIELQYDVLGFYKAVRCGELTQMQKQGNTVHIERSKRFYSDFQAWCREVVWWGNKKGAYLYGTYSTNRELAGHY
jgi:hypothetical protein